MENKKSNRLFFKKIKDTDIEKLKSILQNKDLMLIGWRKIYSDDEVNKWLEKIQNQYSKYGFSYYFIHEIVTENLVGLIGILPVDIKNIEYIELAYIIKKEYWGQGYALESGIVAIDFIFNNLNIDKVIAQILPENISSKKVVEKLGMTKIDSYIRIQNGEKKLHSIYSLNKEYNLKKLNCRDVIKIV